jgi:hypothetical protein
MPGLQKCYFGNYRPFHFESSKKSYKKRASDEPSTFNIQYKFPQVHIWCIYIAKKNVEETLKSMFLPSEISNPSSLFP